MNAAPIGLERLATDVRRDLECLNYPPPTWMPAGAGSNDAPLLDVLIVGGGMCGQTALFALLREGIPNVRIIDRAPRGLEGPWATYARMATLRSPKHISGPDLGVPSLTFRRWYEAQFGSAGWDALYKIPRLAWRDYLLWLRDVLQLRIENETRLVSLIPERDSVQAQLVGPSGEETIRARRVVLAMGRDGSGAPRWPAFPSFDRDAAHGRVLHAADEIDFASFAGARVGVLGAGATAFDNGAAALEAGAATVTLFARRPVLPQINKSKWAAFPGFQHGFVALPDALRWRFLTYIQGEQVPPPHETVLRCDRHAGFHLHLGERWLDVVASATDVRVTTNVRTYRFDVAIIATGFDVDLANRPEIAGFRDDIQLWHDHVSADEANRFPEAARHPYLGEGFELLARDSGAALALGRIHLFNGGSTMSHGQLAGDIPGLATGAVRLAIAIARGLFAESSENLFMSLQNFDDRELEPTRYFVPVNRSSHPRL
ncbi:MAG: FAD-dependent oxidoreductase [Burkholderiales bacterium]